MKVIINIEANGLKPTRIWCIVCKSLETGAIDVFRNVVDNEEERRRFLDYSKSVSHWIGHNCVEYDLPVLQRLLGNEKHFDTVCGRDFTFEISQVTDTLIISKMADYSRDGHATEHYAKEFGIDKPKQPPFAKFSEELVDYCTLLVDITEKIYGKYRKYINNSNYLDAINLEHKFQLVVNDLHNNGFAFNQKKASNLLEKVTKELEELDKGILDAFPPRELLIRVFTPKATLHGTISKSSVPRSLHHQIHLYEAGRAYKHTKLEPFNPSSHKQLIEVLHDAGWHPIDKTKTHLDTERTLNQLKRQSRGDPAVGVEVEKCYNTLLKLAKYGWKINENNLSTLPASAPPPARLLAKRILLEARRRSLTEWLSLVAEDGRVHGKFYGIGAWTHRMAHQQPNTANIPNEFREDGSTKLLGKEMRSLWCAPKNRLLVGVDAEGIQLRIFAHYIDDKEFTDALIRGRKEDKTDPHSLNQRVLGDVCRTRLASKRFVFALLLGAGLGKLAEILGCSTDEARDALDRLLQRYQGFAYLKNNVIPDDAKRGWFTGIDGRAVKIPGDTLGSRKHLCMSGYLQNGEAVVVKRTVIKTLDKLILEDIDSILVNVVHDEVIFEIPNDVRLGEHVSELFCRSIEEVGVELNLKCPLAGDGHVGLNWYEIH